MRRSMMMLVVAVALAAAACDQGDENQVEIEGGADTGTSANNMVEDAGDGDPLDVREDALDGGAEPDSGGQEVDTTVEEDGGTSQDVEESDGFVPVDTRPQDTGEDPGVSGTCEEVEDLGELSFGATELTFGFTLANDNLRTSCRDLQAPSEPEKIYEFTVPERSALSIDASPNYTFEVRTGPCGDEESIETCNPNGVLNFVTLSPNTTYYLVVEFEEVANEDPDYTIELVLDSLTTECQVGESSCVDAATVEVCDDTGSFQQVACPGACDGGSCVGNSCGNPIEVTSSTTVTYDLATFSNTMPAYTCGQGGLAQMKAGQELVFVVRGAQAGQTIEVDAAGDALVNTLVVQRDQCSALAPCSYGPNRAETLSYTVPDAGDYYVIIDMDVATSGTTAYSVTVN